MGIKYQDVIDPTLRVFHVGGRGAMGPVECLLPLGKSLSLSVFEANIEPGDVSWDFYDKLTADYANRYGIQFAIIPQCLSNRVGKADFHVNVMPDCSSLYDMSPYAKEYTRMSGASRIVWGQICQPARTIEIDVTTLDSLYANGMVQLPHFLSLDIQGAECDTLDGASEALKGDLLGVLTEVEFRELYEGQKLFIDQYALLKKHEFILFELYNPEYWHSGLILGKGVLTVAEALFLRDFQYFVKRDKEPAILLSNLSKLAAVAYRFERKSYAFEIMEYIMRNLRAEWEILVTQSKAGYLYDLGTFYQKVITRRPQLEKVPTYQEYMAMSKPMQAIRLLRVVPRMAYNLSLKEILHKLRAKQL